jgi:hypothetical protein
LLCIVLVGSAQAQSLVAPENIEAINRLMDSALGHNSLPCTVYTTRYPSLDFAFRYIVGFSLRCQFGLIQPGTRLQAFIRVKPKGGRLALLAEHFDIPSLPPNVSERTADLKSTEISMSGVFAVGIGHYTAELVVVDLKQHNYHVRWAFNAGSPKVGRTLPLALSSNQVVPILADDWDGQFDERGMRLTIFLHAVPVGNHVTLQAWDRAELLQYLLAVLRRVPCRSLRVVAFNLEQGTEIFRTESFDREGFRRLAAALTATETATVPYMALQRNAWQEFLIQLTRKEASTQESPDALVLLGPRRHLKGELPAASEFKLAHIPVFYFRFFARVTGSDGLQLLTQRMHGTTFDIYTADDLARATQKMLSQIRPHQKDETVGSGR